MMTNALRNCVAAMCAFTSVYLGYGGTWSLRLEPVYMETYGHDPHILTTRNTDVATGISNASAVNLDTGSGFAYSGGIAYVSGDWTFGVDFRWFVTSQKTPDLSLSSNGPPSELTFDITGRSFVSTEPDEILYYRVLEDTDLAIWTFDWLATRTLIDTTDRTLGLQLGVRFADFDNDYRAVAGVTDVEGRRFDASSNYGRMTGPLIGLTGTMALGSSSTLDASLSHSVVLGNPTLSSMARDFLGTFSDDVSFVATESFETKKDVAIPITEFALEWRYLFTEWLSAGVGVNASAWWDVPVPPGAEATDTGIDVLHENTIVFVGILGSVELSF